VKPFRYKNNILHFDSINLELVLNKHETPLFIALRPVAENVLDAAAAIAAVSGRVKLFVSVKTNDDATWLHECCRRGFGVEVVSRLELEYVISLGCCVASNIIYNGPAKSTEDIAYSCAHAVGIINIDSYSEALRIKKVCEDLNQKQVVGIRLCLNPDGRWSKFGVIPGSKEWNDILAVIKSCQLMELEGLHFHEPSTMSSRDSFHKAAHQILEWADLLTTMGINIQWIDFGGGKLPNDYNTDKLLDVREWINSAPSELTKFRVYLELGKALVNDVFVLVTKCIASKEREDKRLIILDAGVNVVGGRHANMEYSRYYPLHESSITNTHTMLCGPMCFPTDIMDDNVMLPGDFGDDDILVIPSCGAYTLTLRWKGTVKTPPVVWIS